MLIMAVDLGKARTGIAACDNGFLAYPVTVISEKRKDVLLEKVAEEVKKADLVVVGLPKNMDGSLGWRAEECTETAQKIKEKSGKQVVMWDERCTTVSAHTALNFTDTRGKKRKEVVDAVAAVIILEDYLSFRKNQKPDIK